MTDNRPPADLETFLAGVHVDDTAATPSASQLTDETADQTAGRTVLATVDSEDLS